MKVTIFILIFLSGALIFEALAHSLIIKGLTFTTRRQSDKENELWHLFFFMMWTCLSGALIAIDQSLWKILIYLATSRLFLFATVLNLSRGMPINHLGEDFIDSLLAILSPWGAFIFRALLWIASIIYIFQS